MATDDQAMSGDPEADYPYLDSIRPPEREAEGRAAIRGIVLAAIPAGTVGSDFVDALVDRLIAAFAPADPEGEPVAWQYRYRAPRDNGEWCAWKDGEDENREWMTRNGGYQFRDLYTHPAVEGEHVVCSGERVSFEDVRKLHNEVHHWRRLLRSWASWLGLDGPGDTREIDYFDKRVMPRVQLREGEGAREALKALRPFADYARLEDSTSGHGAPDDGEVLRSNTRPVYKTITTGDFRRAREVYDRATALASQPEAPEDPSDAP